MLPLSAAATAFTRASIPPIRACAQGERMSAIILASDMRGAHAYVCGPPPMVEAALPLLATLGVEEKRIYYDKFTTTGNPQE